MVEAKTRKPPSVKHKCKPPSNICKNIFNNKAMEFINLPRILHDPVGRFSIPSHINKFNIPTVIYNPEKPIHSWIFNFSTTVSNLHIDRFVQVSAILQCNSEGFEFIDQHHKNILTGNLKIISDNKIRNLFTKSPKYYEKIYFEKAKLDIFLSWMSVLKPGAPNVVMPKTYSMNENQI